MPCGTPRVDSCGVGWNALYNHLHGTLHYETGKPGMEGAGDAVTGQGMKEMIAGYCIKDSEWSPL